MFKVLQVNELNQQERERTVIQLKSEDDVTAAVGSTAATTVLFDTILVQVTDADNKK